MHTRLQRLWPWLLAVALLGPALAQAGRDDGGPLSMHVAIDYRLDLPRESGGMRCTPVRLAVQWEGDLKPTDRALDGKRPALLFKEHGPLRATVEGVRTCTNPDDGTTTVHHYQAARDATGVVTLELFTEVDAGRWEPLPRLSLEGFTSQPAVFYSRDPDGDVVAHFSGFEFAPKGVIEGRALLPDFRFSELEFRDGFKKTFRFWSEVGPDDAVESGTVTFSYTHGLLAIPVVVSTVARGETVVLDGTKSEGNPKHYEWRFKRKAADGAAGDAINANAVKDGARTSVVLLDSVDIALRVSDGKRSDERTVSVSVLPRRHFRTPFEHVTQEADLPDSDPPVAHAREVGIATRGRKLFDAQWTGADNDCAIDPTRDSNESTHILHPNPAKASSDQMFTIARVADPGGPWDGFHYVKDWRLEIKRQSRVNRFIRENGPPQDILGGKNFYQYNVEFRGQIRKYLELVRDHEMEHSRRMTNALRERDPAKDLEKAYGKDAERLRKEGENRIRIAAEELHERSKDPLPESGSADLVLPVKGKNEWAIIPAKVGGEGYGSF